MTISSLDNYEGLSEGLSHDTCSGAIATVVLFATFAFIALGIIWALSFRAGGPIPPIGWAFMTIPFAILFGGIAAIILANHVAKRLQRSAAEEQQEATRKALENQITDL